MTIDLGAGDRASIAETDGDRVTLTSTRAYPPGSTLEGTLSGGGAIHVKVRGCRKDGSDYRVEGRFVNLSRELRQKLLGR